MAPQRKELSGFVPIVAGYVRRSSLMQKDNFSIDAQKRSIQDECTKRGLPEPVFYEDDERSARSEQITKRPAFRRLLEDVEAGFVQIVMVHTLDRWSRNVMVTLQTFRILSQKQTAFLSLSEHIDYSTPEGRLQLTILAAFAAYFSDMLSKHTTKGKGERAAQGLHNGDVPFGYRSTGPKTPLVHDPKNFAGLRLIGALSIQGQTADQIADALNEAGYRTGSKRFGDRLFNKDTVAGILRNEFYAAFAPGDDRGTIRYQGQRHRGVHEAAFSVEEWEQIRSGLGMNVQAPHRSESAKKVYEFAGFIADIHCGLPLRCGGSGDGRNMYYRDVAKLRQLPCPVGGSLLVRVDTAREQFGEFLQGFTLPPHWQEEVHSRFKENLEKVGNESHNPARERERLKQKRNRILKQHREGYISDKELRTEMAAVDLALSNVAVPDAQGTTLDVIMEAGERLPSIAALWNVAKPEERREMVMALLEPGGLYYDLEEKLIAAIKPRPAFWPILRLMTGLEEYSEAYGTLVTSVWRQRNRRASTPRPDKVLLQAS